MATYNGAKYIKEQLDSIIPQLRDDDELIVSDDASKDDTLKIVFERMCVGSSLDSNGKPRNCIRDYSVFPKIIYDKRKRRTSESG
jgi:GT2 family glycosyltransferase